MQECTYYQPCKRRHATAITCGSELGSNMRRSEGKEPLLRTSILNHSPLVTAETRIKSEMARKVRENKRTKAFRWSGKDSVQVARSKRRDGAFHGEFKCASQIHEFWNASRAIPDWLCADLLLRFYRSTLRQCYASPMSSCAPSRSQLSFSSFVSLIISSRILFSHWVLFFSCSTQASWKAMNIEFFNSDFLPSA